MTEPIEPNFDWHWCWQQDQLCLQTSAGLQRTALCRNSVASAAGAFTLGQAEIYWQCLFALEPLHWPQQSVFSACVDAVAQLDVTRPRMDGLVEETVDVVEEGIFAGGGNTNGQGTVEIDAPGIDLPIRARL